MGGGKPTYHYLGSLNSPIQKRATHGGLYDHSIATTNHMGRGFTEGGFTSLTEASNMTHTHMCGALPPTTQTANPTQRGEPHSTQG